MNVPFRSLFLSVLFLFGCSLPLSAQRARFQPQTHQLELRVASLDWYPQLSGYLGAVEAPLQVNAVNGLRYQYAYSLSDAFRMGAAYVPATWSHAAQPNGIENYEATTRQIDLQLGYVRRIHTGPLQWYLGADLRGSRGNLAETGAIQGTDYAQDYTYLNYGVDGVAGVRMFFGPFVSFALEGNATYLRHVPQVATGGELPHQLFGDQLFSTGAQAYVSFHFVKLKKRCTCPKIRRGP